MQAQPISLRHLTNCGHCPPERKRAQSNARFITAVFAQSGVRAQHSTCAQRPKKYQSIEVAHAIESA